MFGIMISCGQQYAIQRTNMTLESKVMVAVFKRCRNLSYGSMSKLFLRFHIWHNDCLLSVDNMRLLRLRI